MKRFLIRCLLTLIPVVLFFVWFENKQREMPHEFKYKAQFMEEHADQIETIVIGPSYFHCLDLREIDSKAFNLSYRGQPADINALLWNKYKEKMPRLKCVVTAISYWFHSNRSTGVEAWRRPFYNIYYDLDRSPLDLQNSYFSANPKIAVRQLVSIVKGETLLSETLCDSLGSSRSEVAYRPENWEEVGVKYARMHSDFLEEDATFNASLLRGMIEDCRQRGIQVILITPPMWHTYFDKLSDRVKQRTLNLGTSLDREYDHVCYMNLQDDPRFTAGDFFDSTHLSFDTGGKKLAQIINQKMKELGLTDTKNNPTRQMTE